jgi:3-oxoacyl-[acyl-carrier protein] reductase
MDLGIRDRVALVSGGSRGIGREVARVLSAEGVKIVIAARTKDAVDEAVAGLEAEGGTAIGLAADMTDPVDIERVVAAAQAAYGNPDIVISNVHGPGPGDFMDVTPEDFERVMREMTLSVIHLTRAVLPGMREKGWGRLVNIGSGAAKEPPPDLKHILANTARAAVVTLNKSLSNEYGKDGITVNTVATGFIATDRMWGYIGALADERGTTAEEAMAGYASGIPLRRPGTPWEIASVIAFLCSEQAGYVTGQLIPVDGGVLRSAF